MEEDYDEIDRECAVLEAIYWDCTILKTHHANKTPAEIELQISLLPLKASSLEDTYVHVDLCIRINNTYPKVVPKIYLKNAQGLNNNELKDLLTTLKQVANSLVGQLMLHELCQSVRQYLSEHNLRPMSCHENMVSTQRQKNEDIQVENKLRLQEKCLIENDEIKRIEMELKKKKEEFKKLKKRDFNRFNSAASNESDEYDTNKLNNNNMMSNLEEVFQLPEVPTGSRLKDDFEMLEKLGHGGFGDVLKVQNKLDVCFYALKRIPLDPRNRGITSKITREVKLLSRLNHENVVRYYNSWMETWQGSQSSAQEFLKGSEKVTIDSSRDLFECSTDEESEASTLDEDDTETDNAENGHNPVSQFLYIQMEYCEKSTLKDVIDGEVYKDEAKVWRLFREVVEGLVHIHDQGIIHRDLKPVNIFMDSNNHVKIGDFGLATFSSEFTGDISSRSKAENKKSAGEFLQRSLTSNVGTALYASPEIVNMENCYNQKVDLYSVGIILFEMSYKKFQTGMERNSVLSQLRKAAIKMPSDAHDYIAAPQRSIIVWLLNHTASKRPTARELLSSEHLPPPAFDDQYFDHALISAIKNSKSHAHKSLLHTIFSQSTTTAVEYTYDHYITKGQILPNKKNLWNLVQSMTKVFSRHGAVHIDTPLLFPYPNNLYSEFDDCSKLMNRAGNIVVLPHDTKIGFARFIEKTNTESLKRYHIGKVFRENLLNELHPREAWVASYDVVSPASTEANVLNDLDIFLVLSHLLESLNISERQYELKFNHRGIITSILTHCGIPKDRHPAVFLILTDNKNANQRKARLANLDLEEEGLKSFACLSQKEGSVADVSNHLKAIINQRTAESIMVKNAMSYLEKLFSLLETCGIKFKTSISLSLSTEINLYSGFFFQFSRSFKRKVDVVAIGGCFSSLFQHFRQLGKVNNSNKHAVGMTIYLERFLTDPTLMEDLERKGHVDVVVMSYQPGFYLCPIISLLKSLRANTHRCLFFNKEECSFEDTKTYCKLHNVPYLILVDSELSLYRIDEKEKLVCREKKESKLLEILKKRSQYDTENKSRKTSCNEDCTQDFSDSITPDHYDTPPVDVKLVGSSMPYCFKNKVLHHTHETLVKFNKNQEVKILVTELQKRIVKSIASQVELKENSSLLTNINAVCKEFPREKKHITKVADEIISLNLNKNQILILYSANDDYYKVIL